MHIDGINVMATLNQGLRTGDTHAAGELIQALWQTVDPLPSYDFGRTLLGIELYKAMPALLNNEPIENYSRLMSNEFDLVRAVQELVSIA